MIWCARALDVGHEAKVFRGSGEPTLILQQVISRWFAKVNVLVSNTQNFGGQKFLLVKGAGGSTNDEPSLKEHVVHGI